MAFNPFNVFRRNQKAIFAVLTVFIMFMFVLSSGLGGGADFFEWLPQWLGSKTRKGDHLATIDGTKVYSGDLDALYRQRFLANRFMSLAAEVTLDQLDRQTRNLQPRMSQRGREVFQQVRNAEGMIAQFANNPQLLEFVFQNVQRAREELRQLAVGQSSSPEDREAANLYFLAMALGQQRQQGGGEHYFSNAPNATQRDRIDFLLWEKKADQLGIVFTQADVKALIQKEFMGQFVSDVAVREAMNKSGQGGFSMEACLKAIGTEFRVRAAQTAVLGVGGGRADRTATAVPAFTPPFEQFQYFRDNASPTTYQVLAVPAAAFAGDVPGTPTEAELQQLYRQFSSQEPNPAAEQPGFKQPRQIKLEWLSAKGDEPYFKQAAAERLGKGQAANVLAHALAGGPLGAAAAAPLLTSEPLLDESYKSVTEAGHRRAMISDWGFMSVNPRPLDTSLVRPETLAGAAGAAAGAVSSFGMNFAAAQALGNRVWGAEQRDRIAVGVPAFLGAVPGPGLFATIMAGEARSQAAVPKALPVAVVRPQLQKELAEREARKVMVDDLRKLQDELTTPDMLKARDKSDARKKVAEFVAKRGLQTGKSADGEAGFRDEWSIGEDPGLAPVKAALEKREGRNNPHRGVSAPIQFGRSFFWTATRGGRTATRDTYKPEFYPDPQPTADVSPFAPPEPVFLVWRTDDKPAATLAYPVAKPKVVEAWKRAKARELAKTRADDIAALIQKESLASETAIRQNLEAQKATLLAKATDPKAAEQVKLFELAGVAPIAPVEGPAGGGPRGSVQQFMLTPTTNIPYPTPEMEKTLIAERTKPVKTAVVLADAPKDTYYVAVVTGRAEKTEAAFKQDVFSESQLASARRLVVGMLRNDSERKAVESVMALIKQEFKYVETEDQKQKLDENQRKGGES